MHRQPLASKEFFKLWRLQERPSISVQDWLSSLEVLEVLEVLDVMRCVLLCILAVRGTAVAGMGRGESRPLREGV